MTQVHEPRFGDFGEPTQPQRTSALAVLALITGILSLIVCCIPFVGTGLGLIGAVCGVAALIFIGGSMGRLTGKGMAVSGLVCAILALVFNIAIIVGITTGLKLFQNYGEFVTIAQSEDQTKLAGMLAPDTAQAVTPEDMARFKKDTTDALGKFQRIEPGMMNLMSAFMRLSALGPAGIPSQYQGKPGGTVQPIPMLATFEKGQAMVLIIIEQDPAATPDPNLPAGKIVNFGVFQEGKQPIWFIDPNGP